MEPNELVDVIGAFAADLLTEARYERFVRALLAAEQGSWHRVADLTPLPAALTSISREFFVATLAAVGDSEAAYRTVVFVCRDPWYDMVATFNGRALSQPRLQLHRAREQP
jgi:hypothetical protein